MIFDIVQQRSKISCLGGVRFQAQISFDFGRLAQRLERLLHTQEVTGSNPVSPTINFDKREVNK